MELELKFEKLTDKIYVCASSDHRFGTDAFLLAAFSGYRQKDKVCDLGTGCGIIPLIMQKSRPPQIIYAVDIQEGAIQQLHLGIEKSKASGIVPICADLKELWAEAPIGRLDLVTCNPPYKAANAGCAAAEKLLKFGGRLCVCNRPERLSDVLFAMKNHGIEPKRLRFVSKNPDESPWLFLVEGKKGSKPFMQVEPQLYIRSENGFSDELQKIYDIGKEQNQ